MNNILEKNFVSAVICINRDDINAKNFLEQINHVLESNFEKYEIICVNNKASEYVIKELREFRKNHNYLTMSIINMGYEHSLEHCMVAGVDLSIGDFVFQFDSCCVDYDMKLIMEAYHKSLQGYDVVAAVPPRENSKLISKCFYSVFHHFSDKKVEIRTERFLIMSRRALNRISAYSKTIPYRKAIYTEMGLKYFYLEYERNVSFQEKVISIGKVDTALDSLILFTSLAYKCTGFLSIFMALFMIMVVGYTVWDYFVLSNPVEGWAPLMGVLSLGLSMIFVVLTAIIKYLDVLVNLTFKQQKYVVESIEKL